MESALPQAQVDSMNFWKMLNTLASSTLPTENKAPANTPLLLNDISAPVKNDDDMKEAESLSEISFRGEQISIAHPAQARMLFFVRRFTFVYVRDLHLRDDIARVSTFDEEGWEYEPGTHIYRLGDLTYLLHRLSRDPGLRCDEYFDDLELLFNQLSDELDRMNNPEVQIELSLSRDLIGPGEWLQYFYWCHIVNNMQLLQGFVVRVDQHGRISPTGQPKPGRILGARQVGRGLFVCCTWRWGSNTVFIPDIQHLNIYGLFFSDSRMQSTPLLQGWAAQALNVPATVGDIYWGLNDEIGPTA